MLAVADNRLILEALVEQLEANEVAKVEVLAGRVAYHVTDGIAAILEVLGYLERRR